MTGSTPCSKPVSRKRWPGLGTNFSQPELIRISITWVLLTLWVCQAPEDDWSVSVFLGTEYVVEHESKSVKMADMEWAKVVVKCIVEQLVVYGEVERLLPRLEVYRRLWCINSALRSLRG